MVGIRTPLNSALAPATSSATIRLISSDLKSDLLGKLRFETGKRPGSKTGQKERYALLTERQSLLLITMVRNTDEALDAFAKHCKGIAKRYPLQTAGGLQEVRVLAEPDLYRLIAKSNLPEAERFEAWVFEEVLPTIRKTGEDGHSPSVLKFRPPPPPRQ